MFHEHEAIICTVLEGGNLELTLSCPEARDWLIEGMQSRPSDDLLWEGMEHYWCNGQFEPFCAGLGNPFVGLTDAPCIAEAMDLDDNGLKTIHGRCWWFPAYMVRDFAQDLLEWGRAIFQLAP
jgi:hypothetical protein